MPNAAISRVDINEVLTSLAGHLQSVRASLESLVENAPNPIEVRIAQGAIRRTAAFRNKVVTLVMASKHLGAEFSVPDSFARDVTAYVRDLESTRNLVATPAEKAVWNALDPARFAGFAASLEPESRTQAANAPGAPAAVAR